MQIVALGTLQLLAFGLDQKDMLLRLGALRAVDGVSFLFKVIQGLDVMSVDGIIRSRVLPSPEEVKYSQESPFDRECLLCNTRPFAARREAAIP